LRPTDQQKKEVTRFINKWRPKVFVGEWQIFTNFKKNQDRPDVACSIDIDWEYLRATINVYPGHWDQTKQMREFAILHELCHIQTHELEEMAHDLHNGRFVNQHDISVAAERLTQRMANIAFEWS
jgi:hypothetical protein